MLRGLRQNLGGQGAGEDSVMHAVETAHVFWPQRRAILSSLVEEDWRVQEGFLEVATAELRFKGSVGVQGFL